jgi:hypothetical protein
MDNIVDSHMTLVLIELLVHYYDADNSKSGSFDTYCTYITNYINGNTKSLPRSQVKLFDYLVEQLQRQYGLHYDICIDLIVDLFKNRYWKNIYQYQHQMNRFLYN